MSFTREYPVKATRKTARCDGCGTMIDVGEAAIRYASTHDGDFVSGIWHPECRAAEIDLNRQRDTMWYDEWSALDEMEDEDHEWLVADHPVVAARMGITNKETQP